MDDIAFRCQKVSVYINAALCPLVLIIQIHHRFFGIVYFDYIVTSYRYQILILLMLTSTISGGEEIRQVTTADVTLFLRTPEELRHDFVKLQRFICFQPAAQPFPSSAKRFSSASSSWCATSAAPLTPKRSRQSSYLGIVSITTVVSRLSRLFWTNSHTENV